jgi:hypothetical protein
MPPSQIVEAQEQTRDWMKKHINQKPPPNKEIEADAG